MRPRIVLVLALVLSGLPAMGQELTAISDPDRATESFEAIKFAQELELNVAMETIRLRIARGVYTIGFPNTGVLLKGDSLSDAAGTCTGTLVGCQAFVTAAHCVKDKTKSYFVYLQHGGVFAAATPVSHPSYSGATADIAYLRLAQEVTGISPAPLPQGNPVSHGTAGTIVGFGRAGGNAFDFGLKRRGRIEVAECKKWTTDAVSICWDFENPLGPLGEDSSTCHGDSGGPMFAAEAMGTVLVGVTSGGSNDDCTPKDHGYDTRVTTYLSWLRTELGPALSTGSCGDIPAAGTQRARILGTNSMVGFLASTTAKGEHQLTVGEDVGLLRISVNGYGPHVDSFGLEARLEGAPDESPSLCQAQQVDSFAFCEVVDPPAGRWVISVKIDETSLGGAFAKGLYQIAATSFLEDEDEAESASN